MKLDRGEPDTDTNPKDRLGEKKPPLWLVPPALLIEVAAVMKLGAAKYDAYNWRSKKVCATVYISAVLRHTLALLDGEDVDPETGRSHWASIGANAGIMLDAAATGNLVDDRPSPGAAAKLLKELTEAAAAATAGSEKWA